MQEEEGAQKVGMVEREAAAVVLRGSLAVMVVLRGSLAVLVTAGGTPGVVTQEATAAGAEGKVQWEESAGTAWCFRKSRRRMCRSTHAPRCFHFPSSSIDRSRLRGRNSFALRCLPCNAIRRRI